MLPLRRLTAALTLLIATAASAGPDLWIHDKNSLLAIVDVASGRADVIGTLVIGGVEVEITDIAFAPDGRLLGLSATDLYEIDRDTAALTLIGAHGIPEGNALVFETDGVLYAAGMLTTSFYQIDPSTGVATALFEIGVQSAGDLAFHQGELYLSSRDHELVLIDRVGQSASVVGPIGFESVFGLATGDDGVLYGVSERRIIAVDTATGAGTVVSEYRDGLKTAFGSTFFGEALPTCTGEPLTGCLVAGKAKLVVNDKAGGREKFKLTLSRFSAETIQADFGDPVTGDTLYEVCVFDEDRESVVRLTADRAGDGCGPKQKPCWKAKSTKGYLYKDPSAESSGLKKITALSGPIQKGKLTLLGANNARKGQRSLPNRIALRLEGHTSAFVQVKAEGAQCYEAELDNVKKTDAVRFIATKP